MNPVLDASVFIAAISPTQRHHEVARRLYESHPEAEPFLVPELFRVEVIAGLARRGEPPELLDLVDAVIRGPRFFACPMDADLLQRAVDIARVARLRAYDAVYVALAVAHDAPILTLDAEVLERSAASGVGLREFRPPPR